MSLKWGIFGVVLAGSLSAGALNFSNVVSSPVNDATGTDVGDIYRFTNITGDNTVDALLEITNLNNLGSEDFQIIGTDDGYADYTATPIYGTNPTLVDGIYNDHNNERGDDIRVTFLQGAGGTLNPAVNLSNVYAEMVLTFVAAGAPDASSPVTLFNVTTQIDDIDSNTSFNNSDFAGLKAGTFDTLNFNDVTLLEFRTDQVPGYVVGRMIPDGSGDWDMININYTAADPLQEQITASFFNASVSQLHLIAGLTGPDNDRRHVDFDFTPDIILSTPEAQPVPEPSLLLSLTVAAGLMWTALGRRR